MEERVNTENWDIQNINCFLHTIILIKEKNRLRNFTWDSLSIPLQHLVIRSIRSELANKANKYQYLRSLSSFIFTLTKLHYPDYSFIQSIVSLALKTEYKGAQDIIDWAQIFHGITGLRMHDPPFINHIVDRMIYTFANQSIVIGMMAQVENPFELNEVNEERCREECFIYRHNQSTATQTPSPTSSSDIIELPYTFQNLSTILWSLVNWKKLHHKFIVHLDILYFIILVPPY